MKVDIWLFDLSEDGNLQSLLTVIRFQQIYFY